MRQDHLLAYLPLTLMPDNPLCSSWYCCHLQKQFHAKLHHRYQAHMALQVADTWSKSDLQPSTSEACGSGNVSAAAATTSKALLEAQQKLRISQLQVWRTGSPSLHV